MSHVVPPAELKERLEPLLAWCGCGAGPLVVAVSGGGDSMALLLLAHEAYPGRVTGVTIDHGLRPGSAEEAAQVAAWAKARGIPHRRLFWDGPKPKSGVQARARRARYGLLALAAAQLGTLDRPAPVLTAHTREDQIETIVMRSAHGSGPAGLAGMRAAAEIAGAPPVPLLRPLLAFGRERLRASLRERGQAWLEDPSNEDTRFERVRVRRMIAAKAEPWAGAMPDANRPPGGDQPGDRAAMANVEIHPEGFARIGGEALTATVMSKLLRAVGGAAYPPKRAAVAGLIEHMRRPGFRGATLAGCRIVAGPDRFTLLRELRGGGAAAPIRPGESLLWDNRFFVACPPGLAAEDLAIRPLGTAAAKVRASLATRVPAATVAALPGLWRGQNLVTPLLPAGRENRPAPAAIFVGIERVESRLTPVWRAWCTVSAPTVS